MPESNATSGYGFKQISVENLTLPDPLVLDMWTREGNHFRPMTPDDFVRPMLATQLEEAVPFEVRRAFRPKCNVLRLLYWPAITLGSQQVLRVADLASRTAGELRGLIPHQNFGPRIPQLRAAVVIDAEREDHWNLIVRLRNKVTHPEWQETWGLSQTVDLLAPG